MCFLLGIFIGLVVGAIFHTYRTHEQRKGFTAACEMAETLESHNAGLADELRIAVIERDQLRLVKRKAISA